jgi:hypothetical protein
MRVFFHSRSSRLKRTLGGCEEVGQDMRTLGDSRMTHDPQCALASIVEGGTAHFKPSVGEQDENSWLTREWVNRSLLHRRSGRCRRRKQVTRRLRGPGNRDQHHDLWFKLDPGPGKHHASTRRETAPSRSSSAYCRFQLISTDLCFRKVFET